MCERLKSGSHYYKVGDHYMDICLDPVFWFKSPCQQIVIEQKFEICDFWPPDQMQKWQLWETCFNIYFASYLMLE